MKIVAITGTEGSNGNVSRETGCRHSERIFLTTAKKNEHELICNLFD